MHTCFVKSLKPIARTRDLYQKVKQGARQQQTSSEIEKSDINDMLSMKERKRESFFYNVFQKVL